MFNNLLRLFNGTDSASFNNPISLIIFLSLYSLCLICCSMLMSFGGGAHFDVPLDILQSGSWSKVCSPSLTDVLRKIFFYFYEISNFFTYKVFLIQWAAVRTYLELIKDPAHLNSTGPLSLRYPNNAMKGNSPIKVLFPLEILSWFISPQFGPFNFRSLFSSTEVWNIGSLVIYLCRQHNSWGVYYFIWRLIFFTRNTSDPSHFDCCKSNLFLVFWRCLPLKM